MITYTNLGINGRLGNQLFQYAAAKAAAIKTRSLFAIPSENHKLFEYFKLNCKKYSLKQNGDVLSKLKLYNETVFNYDKRYESITDNTNLFGYFQSEKYFLSIEDEIRKDFTFKDEIVDNSKKFLNSLDDKRRFISMHIRRTDYVGLQNFHPLCSLDYYTDAMKYFGESNFLIFSDDIEWCRKNFIGKQYFFSEGNKEIDDLCIMSMCDGNIIANSSYSWWGAWLNKNNNVVAPKKWFGNAYTNKNTEDLYCRNWKIL